MLDQRPHHQSPKSSCRDPQLHSDWSFLFGKPEQTSRCLLANRQPSTQLLIDPIVKSITIADPHSDQKPQECPRFPRLLRCKNSPPRPSRRAPVLSRPTNRTSWMKQAVWIHGMAGGQSNTDHSFVLEPITTRASNSQKTATSPGFRRTSCQKFVGPASMKIQRWITATLIGKVSRLWAAAEAIGSFIRWPVC